jgi:hypothetical protein
MDKIQMRISRISGSEVSFIIKSALPPGKYNMKLASVVNETFHTLLTYEIDEDATQTIDLLNVGEFYEDCQSSKN